LFFSTRHIEDLPKSVSALTIPTVGVVDAWWLSFKLHNPKKRAPSGCAAGVVRRRASGRPGRGRAEDILAPRWPSISACWRPRHPQNCDQACEAASLPKPTKPKCGNLSVQLSEPPSKLWSLVRAARLHPLDHIAQNLRMILQHVQIVHAVA